MADEPTTDKPPKATKVTPPKTKPKSTTGGNDKKPASKKPAGRPRALENQLAEFFSTIGLTVSMVNADDGMVIVQNAEPLAKAWADLAAEDARVRKAIDRVMTGSAWGGVIFATGTVAMGIANNHGMLDGLTGGPDADETDEPPPPPPGMTV